MSRKEIIESLYTYDASIITKGVATSKLAEMLDEYRQAEVRPLVVLQHRQTPVADFARERKLSPKQLRAKLRTINKDWRSLTVAEIMSLLHQLCDDTAEV